MWKGFFGAVRCLAVEITLSPVDHIPGRCWHGGGDRQSLTASGALAHAGAAPTICGLHFLTYAQTVEWFVTFDPLFHPLWLAAVAGPLLGRIFRVLKTNGSGGVRCSLLYPLPAFWQQGLQRNPDALCDCEDLAASLLDHFRINCSWSLRRSAIDRLESSVIILCSLEDKIGIFKQPRTE